MWAEAKLNIEKQHNWWSISNFPRSSWLWFDRSIWPSLHFCKSWQYGF